MGLQEAFWSGASRRTVEGGSRTQGRDQGRVLHAVTPWEAEGSASASPSVLFRSPSGLCPVRQGWLDHPGPLPSGPESQGSNKGVIPPGGSAAPREPEQAASEASSKRSPYSTRAARLGLVAGSIARPRASPRRLRSERREGWGALG